MGEATLAMYVGVAMLNKRGRKIIGFDLKLIINTNHVNRR